MLYGEQGHVTLSNGDLETLVGYVTNYDAKILDNGGVECTVEIMSKNSALINHDFGEDVNIRNRVVSNLDTEAINFAAKYFDDVDLLKPDWNASAESEEEWKRSPKNLLQLIYHLLMIICHLKKILLLVFIGNL